MSRITWVGGLLRAMAALASLTILAGCPGGGPTGDGDSGTVSDTGAVEDAVCVGVCNPGVCGPNTNGCGGSCDCPSGQSCNAGQCACARDCAGKNCGSDGCGGSCGACATGATCSTAGTCVVPDCNPPCDRGYVCNRGTCDLDPAHLWVAVADRGTVMQRDCTGATWDPVGGLPDPQFCMNTNGTSLCTESAADTLSPAWTMGRFPAATAATFMAGVAISYLDVDTTANDTICSGRISIGTQDFFNSESTISCTCSDGSVNATVHLSLQAQ